MKKYYQRHKAIKGFQFNGTIRQLIFECPKWSQGLTGANVKVTYDNKHIIKKIEKITRNNPGFDNNWWPIKNIKFKHIRYTYKKNTATCNHNKLILGSKGYKYMYRPIYQGDYITFNHKLVIYDKEFGNTELTNETITNLTNAYNQVTNSKYVPSEKCVNEGVNHIGPEKEKNYNYVLCEYIEIWPKAEFESQWSTIPIKRK